MSYGIVSFSSCSNVADVFTSSSSAVKDSSCPSAGGGFSASSVVDDEESYFQGVFFLSASPFARNNVEFGCKAVAGHG